MKLLLISLLSLVLMVSCSNESSTPKPIANPMFPDIPYMDRNDWKIITIDSCEYIFGYTNGTDGGPVLTHKGNCKNKIHSK